MDINGLTIFGAIGYDTVGLFIKTQKRVPTGDEIYTMKIHNAISIISYAPIIGTIIGIFMLKVLMQQSPVERKSLIMGYRIRAVVQILSLGVLFFIPDLIFTIGRTLSK